jgi:polyribonucleotide nucleotidyltransferase
MILGKEYSLNLNGKTLKVFIDKIVARSLSSVWVQLENTVVLVTVNVSKENKFLGFLPLTVDYEEKFYAIGKILGSRFIRREGKPSESAILNARLIDRSIRPRFDKNFNWPIHVVATVFSFDLKNDPDLLAVFGASLALSISPLPFIGPIAGCRIGIWNNEKIIDPSFDMIEQLNGEIVFVGDGNLINMIELKGKEIKENVVIESSIVALDQIKKLVDFQKEIINDIKPQKINFEIQIPEKIKDYVASAIDKINIVGPENVGEFKFNIEDLNEEEKSIFNFLAHEKIKELFTDYLFKNKKRTDGRKLDEIREIELGVSILPQVHGSGFFSRGLTKVLSTVTLDSPQQELTVKEIEFIGVKRFMHHYNFPPYSTGEVGSIKAPSRREIGHGALVEKALSPLIPDLEIFPYAIRVVSEVLSSNGSTSMASVCSSSLALLDAGVPLQKNIAGISIGLVTKNDEFLLLTDIQGIEDHYGEMDFKVAGTEDGITAIQMDVKNLGINIEILSQALDRAKNARIEILEKMNKVKKEPNQISQYAPKIIRLPINPEKIGLLIGTGGRTINQITQETESEIFIDTEKNFVYIISNNEENLNKAIEKVKSIIETKEYKVGDIAKGKVVKFFDFGVLIELENGPVGLLHISNIPNERKGLKNFGFKLGEIISVKIKERDNLGRFSFALS